ncbi:MAG TPA: cytochrome c [Gemmataceae bacterium]|nr:cytochrome c [Gemmataceae bacterium]
MILSLSRGAPGGFGKWGWPAFLALILLCGCDGNEYSADLKYTTRIDPLVPKKIDTVPPHLDKPGDFPAILTKLNFKDEDLKKKFEAEKKNFQDPKDLNPKVRDLIETNLDKLFGSPLKPKVDIGQLPEDVRQSLNWEDNRRLLHLEEHTLAEGSIAYRHHCLHCHGLPGDGRGPTAPWVNPHPRDFRLGIFKFTSTKGGNDRKPRREDLLRTLREGIEGTAMPSFGLVPENELQAIISYVIHLSLRGDLEYRLMQRFLSGSADVGDFKDTLEENIGPLVTSWIDATKTQNLILPEASASFPPGSEQRKSVENGFNLFRSTKDAGCIGCHKDYGRQSDYFFDAWGTIGRAADLTTGVYRGGRRPIDFYWRIHHGVNGSNMPNFGNLLKSDEIWDLVSFLQVLPHPKMREMFEIKID